MGGTGGMGGGGMGGTGGMGGSGGYDVTPAANGMQFRRPFDATLDPEGNAVFFTALNANGDPAIFKSASPGATPTALFEGDPLVAPLNIATSTDGAKLFIADVGAEDPVGDRGRIYTIFNDGGVLTELPAADAYRARGIEIRDEGGKDTIYFAGNDPAGVPGVFKLAADGSGSVSAVATGAPFQDPSGVAVSVEGTVYVCDTVQGDGLSSIVSVAPNGTATTILSGIRAGFPCGVALMEGDTTLLVSALDVDKQTDVVIAVDLSTNTPTFLSQGIDTFTESAGLHRAKKAGNAFAWADSTANGGTVFRVTFNK